MQKYAYMPACCHGLEQPTTSLASAALSKLNCRTLISVAAATNDKSIICRALSEPDQRVNVELGFWIQAKDIYHSLLKNENSQHARENVQCKFVRC